MDIYREEILEHWRSPSNFGVIPNADLVVEQVNPLCGDEVTFYFKLTPFVSSPPSIGVEGKLQRRSGTRFRIKSGMTGKESSRPFVKLRARTIIKDVRFTGSGCAISIASASMLSENIKGRAVSALSKITGKDVLELLGGSIAPARLNCAFLSLEAVKKLKAIDN